MLIFSLFSIMFFSLFSLGLYFFPFFLCFMFVYYLLSLSLSLNSSICLSFVFYDELSLFMLYMTFLVLFISFFNTFNITSHFLLNSVLMFMLLTCLVVFTTSNFFFLYLSYEASLLPILYIIIRWGSYPERSVSALMLLIYTSLFTLPLVLFIFYFYNIFGSFSLNLNFDTSFSTLFSILLFCSFAVKLPIYGLHFWLPMAHVEAPTFGSMILAGILLKLGGVGLIRTINLMDISFLKSLFLAYLVLFLFVVTLVCCYQSDFKRLIAYSSVSHMMSVPILLLSNSVLSLKSLALVMFFHGLSSPILFMLVGILYSLFSSRQLMVMRGLILISPLLSFIVILAFFFTLSAPPFPSFVSEVLFFSSSFSLTYYLGFSFLLFAFFSLVYNLNWLSSILFSFGNSFNMNFSFSFAFFFPLSLSFMICFSSLILISFF